MRSVKQEKSCFHHYRFPINLCFTLGIIFIMMICEQAFACHVMSVYYFGTSQNESGTYTTSPSTYCGSFWVKVRWSSAGGSGDDHWEDDWRVEIWDPGAGSTYPPTGTSLKSVTLPWNIDSGDPQTGSSKTAKIEITGLSPGGYTIRAWVKRTTSTGANVWEHSSSCSPTVVAACSDCEDCVNGSCEDNCTMCDSCVSGSCISTCTACERCEYGGGGYTCVNDCPDCKDCVGGSCVGGCEECYECVEWSPGFYDCDHLCLNGCDPPKYCDGCSCIECSLGTADTSTCSSSNDESCPPCDTGIGDSCADHTIKLYEDATLYPCTGADCDDIEEICYKEYDCDDGTILPLMHCVYGGTAYSCSIFTEFPSWCTTCVQDTADQGTPGPPETSYSCPEEGSPP